MEETVFTKAAVLGLLSKIDELKDLPVGITETLDKKLQIQIGDSIYELDNEAADEVEVEDAYIEIMEQINEEAYDELIDEGEVGLTDVTIESGLITEAIKTLAIGGMVRLTNKLLNK